MIIPSSHLLWRNHHQKSRLVPDSGQTTNQNVSSCAGSGGSSESWSSHSRDTEKDEPLNRRDIISLG